MNDFFEIENEPVKKTRYMVLDCGNFLWRNKFAQTGMKGTDEEINAFAVHTALWSLKSFFYRFKPDKIVLAFDQKPYWRSVVLPIYKARREELRKDDPGIENFKKQVIEFADLVKENSSMICLRHVTIEADDWIGRWIQTHPEDDHIIISNDRDFHQLHKFPGVKQWNPMRQGNWVEVEDAEFALFEKCIRGETGVTSDNVPSAYPGIFTKRLKKAWTDSYEMNSIMLHEIPDITNDGKLTKVKELYERNKGLMDLSAQPPEIVQIMDRMIVETEENPGKFDMFSFLQYLGDRNLQRIANSVDDFIPMLSA